MPLNVGDVEDKNGDGMSGIDGPGDGLKANVRIAPV